MCNFYIVLLELFSNCQTHVYKLSVQQYKKTFWGENAVTYYPGNNLVFKVLCTASSTIEGFKFFSYKILRFKCKEKICNTSWTCMYIAI